jgi:serine/threonine-protein kinase
MAVSVPVTGQVLGHYRIVERIGAGGMGVVYRAHDERLDRDVALKVLPAGTLTDEQARKRFRKEAITLSKLNHPNIETVHDFDTQDGVAFLVMEHIVGVRLDDKLAKGPLQEREISRLGVQLMEGLAAAHQEGIVHCDLKPSNLLVTDDGRLKILDFGIAKLLHPISGGATTASVMGTEAAAAGTLPYMSPEQLRDEKVDARSDIWAVGAVLYEMAAGRQAFHKPVAAKLIDAILHQAPAPLGTVNARASPELERIILKCLEKDPEDRYQSARELSVDLRRLSAPTTVFVASQELSKRSRLRRKLAISAGSVLAVLALLVAFDVGGWRQRLLERTGPPRIQSLAVLPLTNLSGDPQQEYFADGMTEALISDLSKFGALRVISRTSIMQYKGVKKPLPQIAKELNVDGVIEGSVQRWGDRVRISAQLLEAPRDRHLWAKSYERDLGDVLALQDEVAHAIANEIRVELTPTESAHLTTPRHVDPEAFELYLKGRYYWNKRTRDGLTKSLAYFQQTVEKDPTYALAYAGLADSYLMLGAGAYGVLPPKEAIPKAEAAANKALELDNTLAEAHSTLGYAKWYFDWDLHGAEQQFKQAIALNPGYANAHHWYAGYLGQIGRYAEAIAEDRKAESLDPLSLIISADVAGETLIPAGLYDQAVEQCRKTLEMDPNFPAAHWHLGTAYLRKGTYNEAFAEIQKAIDLSGGNAVLVSRLGVAYALAGRRDDAVKIVNQLHTRSKREYVPTSAFVYIYAALGDQDQAFAWLEKAYQERSDAILGLRNPNPAPGFDSLRSDPRYQELLRRAGLLP